MINERIDREKCWVRVCTRVTWHSKRKRAGTRWPRGREETNCLHYANAVQLQLTVAKNRCRYRGMLSRTSRGFLFSPSFHSPRSLAVTLVLSIPRILRRGSWNEMVPRVNRSNRSFPISTLHRWKFFPTTPSVHGPSFRLFPTFLLFFSFFPLSVYKSARSLASPLRGTQWYRGKLSSFQKKKEKKPMTGCVMMLVLPECCQKHRSSVVKRYSSCNLSAFLSTNYKSNNFHYHESRRGPINFSYPSIKNMKKSKLEDNVLWKKN